MLTNGKRSARIGNAVRTAGVAQLVEQLICNQQVGGSSPSTSSSFSPQAMQLWETFWWYLHGSVPEWPKGADCKSVVDDFGGSNPPAPTKAEDAVPLARRLLLLGAGPGSAAPGPQPSPDRTGMSTTDCLSSYSRPFAPPISFPGPPPVPIFRNNRSFHGIY